MDCDNYKLVSFIMVAVIAFLLALNYTQYQEINYLRGKITTQNESSIYDGYKREGNP